MQPVLFVDRLIDLHPRKRDELVRLVEGMVADFFAPALLTDDQIRLYLESAVAESEVVDNAFYLLIVNMGQLFLQFSKLQMVKDDFLAFLPDTRFCALPQGPLKDELTQSEKHKGAYVYISLTDQPDNAVRTWVWADEKRALVTRSLELALRVSCPSLKPLTWKHLHLRHNATWLEELVVADNDAEADDRSTSNPLDRQYIGLMNSTSFFELILGG